MSNQARCLACMSDMRGAPACPSCGWQMSSEMDNALYLPTGYLLNNRYTIGKVIGVGGFGIVYIAWDANLDIRVAIKEFLPKEYAARSSNHVSITPYTGSAHDDFLLGVEKFLEEAKALARFQDHPGIVTVHESFRTNNTAYMVMQYLDGMTLKEYLKRQPGEKIAFNVAVKAMTPIMDALREVHNAGFVHRDISPDNIFLTSQNQVKLLDFGSARYAIDEHTKTLTIILKHGYAPLEQYSAKERQGPYSDVYGVCATIYRCVTGFVPLDAMERIQGDTIKTPKQLGIDVPLRGGRVLMRGLALKAVDRYENIQQLQEALATEAQAISREELIGAIQDEEAPLQTTQGDAIKPPPPTPPPGPNVVPWVIASGIFVLLFFVFLTARTPAPAPALTLPTAVDWHNMAVTLWKDGKYTNPHEAIGYLNEAIQLKPDYALAYHHRGNAYLQLDQHQRAIEDYNEAIRLKPDSAWTSYSGRGIAYSISGQHQRAIEDYNEAIRLKPDSAWAYYNRGTAYLRLKNYESASMDYDQAIRIKPDFARAYNERGIAYIRSGNKPMGCSSLISACEMGVCEDYKISKQNGDCQPQQVKAPAPVPKLRKVQPEKISLFCPRCNNKLEGKGYKYCTFCGIKLPKKFW